MSPSISFYKKYKVLSKVGEGSFSEVLKCQERSTGNMYAAKRLKRIKQSMDEALTSTELISLLRLQSHPHILNLIEKHVDPLPGKLTLIFELMDMSLYDMIRSRKRPIPEARVKVYVHQVLKGLSHMHKNGLFHRDIKPENILLKNDVVKIADLGSVKGMYMRRPFTEYISTRWYRSPECLLTKGIYGAKMDIWAAGCVFYELITLKPLFPGHSEVDMLTKIHKILGTPHPRTVTKFKQQANHRNCEFFFPSRVGCGLSSLLPNVSEAGGDFVKQTLAYDPDVRSTVRRLLEHRYFNDLRELDESPGKKLRSPTSPVKSPLKINDWRNPVLLSNYLAGGRRKKTKHTTTVTSPAGSRGGSVSSLSEASVIVSVAREAVLPPVRAAPLHPATHKVPSHIVKLPPPRPKQLERTFTVHHSTHKKETWLKKLGARKESVLRGSLPARLPPIQVTIRGNQAADLLATGGQAAASRGDATLQDRFKPQATVRLASLAPTNVLRLPPIAKKTDQSNAYSSHLPQCMPRNTFTSKLSNNLMSKLETIVEYSQNKLPGKSTRPFVTVPFKP